MQVFKSEYLTKCKELHVEPNSTVLETLNKTQDSSSQNNKSSFYKLDLSGQAMNLKACSALASALTNDVVFTKVILSDAFIGDDGVCFVSRL